MKGFRVEGIILKRRDLGEADRILTVFSLQKGKISVLAKGVRRITSRRGGNVELLNRAIMYLHPAKSFLILTEAEVLETYPRLKEDLTLSTYAFHIIELVDKLTAENQENRLLYEDVIFVLQKLSRNPRQIFVRAFEAKILSNLGFVSFEMVRVFRSSTPSGLSPRDERPRSTTSPLRLEEEFGEIRGIVKKLGEESWEEIEKLEISEKQAIELERVLQYHIERVIEGRLKSRQLLRKI